MQLVVRGVRWPLRLEEPEQSLDQTRQHRPPEAKVFRAHAPQHEIWDILINVLKFLANQQLGGDSPVEVLVESSRTKQIEDDGRAEKVHHGGLSRGGKDWRPGEEPGIAFGGGSQMYRGPSTSNGS